jgi:hypothetical protein
MGFRSNAYEAIREDFRARHVFAAYDHAPFAHRLRRDPRFEQVHADSWCALFRLRDEPFACFLRTWSLLGPLTRDEDEVLVSKAGTSGAVFSLAHGCEPSTLGVTFSPCTSASISFGYVDLRRHYTATTAPVTDVVAYGRATFDGPTSETVLLHVGLDDGGMAWLNGRGVLSAMRHGPAHPSEHVLRVPLRRGANTLDLKIYQADKDWGFYAWITDRENTRVLLHNPDGPAWEARTPAKPRPDSPLPHGVAGTASFGDPDERRPPRRQLPGP